LFYNFANNASDNALLNWVTPGTYTSVKVGGGPAFTVYEGYNGSTNEYLNTNYNPSTNGINYTLNGATLGVYSRSNIDEGAAFEIGCGNSGSSDTETMLAVLYSTNTIARINTTGGGLAHSPIASGAGLFICSRDASNNITSYINNTNHGGTAGLATMKTDASLLLFSRGNKDQQSSKQVSFAFVGGAFTDADVSAMYNAINTYMSSVSPLLTGLVSYWKLDGSLGYAKDSHGTNDGSINLITQDVSGKISNSFVFENTSYVSCPSTYESLNLTTSGTIAAWMFPTAINDHTTLIGKAN
jgi:hypothetical protein